MRAIVSDASRNNGAPFAVRMEPTDEAYLTGGGSWGIGYCVIEADDYQTPCEWLSTRISMGMYEGSERSCIHIGEFSWFIVPESDDKAEHLNRMCPRSEICDFRD